MRLPVLIATALSTLVAAALAVGAGAAGESVLLEQTSEATYGQEGTISGRLSPGAGAVSVDLELNSAVIAQSETGADGSFFFRVRLTSPGPYVVRAGDAVSAPLTIPIRPILRTSIEGRRIVGQRLILRTKLLPARAGRVRLVAVRKSRRAADRFFRAGRVQAIPTSHAGRYALRLTLDPNPGFVKIRRKLRYQVGAPPLRRGSRGRSVRLLERELVAHRFALGGIDGLFGYDTLEAVYALQKMAGLARTGSMDEAAWRTLATRKPPRPRLRGNYIEVDKTKQVLYVVRRGKVHLIIPVSTGATGNTPIGLFHFYSKVPGGAVMYYSSYFTGAFAVHGYVDVPPYPASHGCVRVPMWVAPRLYGMIPLHSRVLIHY